MMDLSAVAWMFAAAFGASALGGALGMASGIFIVPILTTFAHLDIHAAIVVSIVSVTEGKFRERIGRMVDEYHAAVDAVCQAPSHVKGTHFKY